MRHPSGGIFVFGSNLAGIHGAGAALDAMNMYGAKRGQGVGIQGDSYAIPTRDEDIVTLPLGEIARHVMDFLDYADSHLENLFFVTAIGTGLAGYEHYEIAPLFEAPPPNLLLPKQWVVILGGDRWKHLRGTHFGEGY